MMKLWIKVKDNRIKECKWQKFGCASAIASTSMLSVMVTRDGGMKLEKALQLKPQDIVTELGSLPARKFHCSVLGDKALRAAINDYFRKSNQVDRIVTEGAKVIDLAAKVTDKDIEEEILEMGDAIYNSTDDEIFEVLQKNLKVGVGDKSCIPQVYQLIRFYKEKYFGDD
jgi:ABC-type Fe3+-hydroxamate transport system substrate-binding protein